MKGEDLRAVLEDALRPFMSEESAKKLAPGGSSQRNECVNSVVGSKAPKSGTKEGLKLATFEPQRESPSSTKGIATSHLPQKKWVCQVRLLQKSILEKWKAKGSGTPKGKRLRSLKG